MCVCLCVRAHVCVPRCMQVLWGPEEDDESPEDGVISHCERPLWMLGIQLRFSGRASSGLTLSNQSSPSPPADVPDSQEHQNKIFSFASSEIVRSLNVVVITCIP